MLIVVVVIVVYKGVLSIMWDVVRLFIIIFFWIYFDWVDDEMGIGYNYFCKIEMRNGLRSFIEKKLLVKVIKI